MEAARGVVPTSGASEGATLHVPRDVQPLLREAQVAHLRALMMKSRGANDYDAGESVSLYHRRRTQLAIQ